MKSPGPVIFLAEVEDLPLPAAAALACRAVQRTLEILPHADRHRWPDPAYGIAHRLIDRLSEVANGSHQDPSRFMLGKAAYEESMAIREVLESGSSRRMAWIGIQNAMTPGGAAALHALGDCAGLSWNIKPKGESRRLERIIKNANWEDFKQIRLAFESGELTEETPVPPDSLGPLWPKGPHDWSKYTWRDVDAENAEQKREYEEQQRQGQKILDSLVPRSDAVAPELRDALDRAARVRGEGWRHAFMMDEVGPIPKWPAALRKPTTPVAEELLAFYRVHGWGGLLIPPGEREGSLWIIPAEVMNAQRAEMLEWDSAIDCFDSEAIEEANRYSVSIGLEPDAKPAPCSKRDILVFAKVNASPNAFFVVTKGPAAGKVFFFDHETGIDFDDPIADSLVGWIDALVDPERDWEWMEDEED